MNYILRPNWVEIELTALKKNIKKIKKLIKNKKLMAIVKADAYGHGMIEISRSLEQEKSVNFFGVSSIEEGIILRENRIKKAILILGNIYPFDNFKYLFKFNLIPTISSIGAFDELLKYSRKNNLKIDVHLKLETGMNRIGMSPQSLLKLIDKAASQKNITIQGIYSHFSSTDIDMDYTKWQLDNYINTINKIKGIKFIKHIANSSAIINIPQSHLDMVRCGIATYGNIYPFEQILTWKTKIVFLKHVKKGSFIGYSKSYKTKRYSKIATIPVGYGDGYIRALSNKSDVLIKGKRVPLIGNIAMDMAMIDVTDINAHIGDEVILTGRSKNEFISINELASKARTIPYEITTLITKRVRRIYK